MLDSTYEYAQRVCAERASGGGAGLAFCGALASLGDKEGTLEGFVTLYLSCGPLYHHFTDLPERSTV